MDDRAIGVFDSGLGGLTAVSALTAACPNENIIYFGDTGRMPYGGRTPEELLTMARQNTDFLSAFGVKTILVACGTVSSTVLPEVRAQADVPMFGVIDAAVTEALEATKNSRVGVIATEATVRSGAFGSGLRAGGCKEVIEVACPKLVPLIEAGHTAPEDSEVRAALEEYLRPIAEAGADTLILGCTHYPLLEDAIRAVLGDVYLVSSGAAAARALLKALAERDMLSARKTPGVLRCHTSGDAAAFAETASGLLGRDMAGAVQEAPVFPL